MLSTIISHVPLFFPYYVFLSHLISRIWNKHFYITILNVLHSTFISIISVVFLLMPAICSLLTALLFSVNSILFWPFYDFVVFCVSSSVSFSISREYVSFMWFHISMFLGRFYQWFLNIIYLYFHIFILL